MKSRLAEMSAQFGSRNDAKPGGTDKATADRLRALGYLAAARQPVRPTAVGLADPKDKIGIFESIWKAEKQLASGNPAGATAGLESVVAQDGRIYLSRWLLGLGYYRQGRLAEALDQFNAASALRPEESRPFMYAGMSAMRLGRLPEARRALENASSLQPSDDAVINNLAALYLQTREWERAADLLSGLAARNPSDVAAWTNLGVAHLYGKDLAGAYDAFERALALKPDQPEIHNNLGMVQAERGNIDGAIGAYRRAIELRPDYGRAHYNLALALQKKGLREEAAREFGLSRQSER
jgi:Flp pilus assembly protein TadD